jgi:CheY-like chemotaxis protein
MDNIHINDNDSARSMSSSSDSMNMSRHSNNNSNSINIVTINNDNNKNINNKKNLPVENLTSNDVICCLWNKNALEKCRIGLADVLIYEGGKPTRWYVTGKTGEVTKKRSIDLTLITQRWLKIREQYNSPMVAIIKQEGGIMKFLNIEAFERFLQDNISSSTSSSLTTNSNHNANQNVSSSNIDLTINSIHCFIHGDNHIVYRNKYQLRDIKGRVNTSTLTYSLNLSSNTTTESVVTMYEHSLIFHESKAMQIKSILDLATTTVVRYVETMLSIKLLEITIDYIIDKNSQIWMLWCLNTQFVRSTRLEDLNLPIPNIDKDGRISWMGRKYLEELDESKRREVLSSPSLQHHNYRLSTPSNNNIYNSRGGIQDINTFGAELIKPSIYSTYPKLDDHEISPHIAALQVNEAANVTVSDAFAPKSSLQRKRVNENHSASYQLSTIHDDINQKGPLLSSAPLLSRPLLLSPPSSPQLQQLPSSSLLSTTTSTTITTVNKLSSSSNASLTALSLSLGSYPNAFKCKGDYCNFLIESKHASISDTAIEHLTKKLFTESEILRLRKDKNFNKMMEFESTGPALAIMTMRSIVLARQERRGLIAPDINNLNNQPWNKYPESPRNKINFPSSSLLSSSSSSISANNNNVIDGNNHGIDDSKEQKIIEDILKQDKDQRESFTKSMSTYYDQIRVCGVCFSIYTCLDWARDILGKGDAYGAGLNGVGAAYPKLSKLQPRIRTNDNILLLKGKDDNSSSTIESSAIAVDDNIIRLSKTTSSLIPSYASATTASIASQIPKKDHHQQQQQQKHLSSTLPTSSNQSSSPIRQSSSSSSSSYSHLPSVTSTLIGRDDESISTWKSYISQAKREEKKVEGNKFVQLDDYLRGGNAQLADRKGKEKVKQQQQMKVKTATDDHTSLSSSSSSTTTKSNKSYNTNVYHGKVLLACELNDYSRDAKMILEEAYYDVTHAYEGRQAVNNHILLKDGYDCILVQRDLPLINAIELTKEIRKDELIKRKEAAAYAASQGKDISIQLSIYISIYIIFLHQSIYLFFTNYLSLYQ